MDFVSGSVPYLIQRPSSYAVEVWSLSRLQFEPKLLGKRNGIPRQHTKSKDNLCSGCKRYPNNAFQNVIDQNAHFESVRVLNMIDKTLVSILAQMRDLASGLKEYNVVLAMPGVGNIPGPRIIAEIGDARRFHSGSALVAYVGLDAPPYQSGTFTGTNKHISKRGLLHCVKPDV